MSKEKNKGGKEKRKPKADKAPKVLATANSSKSASPTLGSKKPV